MSSPEASTAARTGAPPTRPRVRIENTTGAAHQTKIYIDGVDVSECFTNATVRLDPSLRPNQNLVVADLTVLVAELDIDGAQLVFPTDGTRELLIKHGWTPPADESDPHS